MLRYPTAASLRPGLANLAKLHFPLVKPLANLGLPAPPGVIPRGGGGVCETRRVQGDQGAYRPRGEHAGPARDGQGPRLSLRLLGVANSNDATATVI